MVSEVGSGERKQGDEAKFCRLSVGSSRSAASLCLIDPALGARDNARDAMRATFLLGALLSTTTVSAQRPKLSSGTAAKGTSQDESLGSQLLSTVLSNDVQQAR